MSIKENANTLIDNSGILSYNNVSGKPSTIVEIVDIFGSNLYYTATFLSTSKTLVLKKSLNS